MDSRTARRAAEKAARDLIATRAALVGALGVADAERSQLVETVTAATDRGRQLVADATAEAARLVKVAHDLTAAGEQRYTDAYTAARTAGWAVTDLTALGFAPPPASSTRRRRAVRAGSAHLEPVATDAAAAGTARHVLSVPEQHTDDHH